MAATDPYGIEVEADSPVAWWRLGETAGATSSADETGNGNTLTPSAAGVTFGAGGALVPSPALTAVTLDDTNGGQLTAANSASLNSPTTGVTLEVWVKPTTGHFGSQKMAVCKPSSASFVDPFYQYGMAMDGSNKQIWWVLSPNGTYRYVGGGGTDWVYDDWNHLVGTWDGSVGRLYVNGGQFAQSSFGGTLSGYDTSLVIGGYGSRAADASNNFGGSIDEVAVYASALSAQRVADHYAAATAMFLGVVRSQGHPQAIAPAEYPTTALAGALRGPVAYGPVISRAGEAVPDIAAHLYRRADLTTAVATLDDARDRRWRAQHNDPGSGSLVLQNDDPDLAEVGDTDVIRFEFRGRAALSILATERASNTIDPGEEAAQATTVSGPGTLAVLADALVYPVRGTGGEPVEEDRVFNWTSLDYDDSRWGHAAEMAVVVPGSGPADPDGTQVDPPWWWAGAGDTWPNAITRWIWAPGSDFNWAYSGWCYVRQAFYLSEECDLMVYASGDNSLRIYCDGAFLYENPYWFLEDHKAPVHLAAGWHVLAADCQNMEMVPGAPANPGGIAITAHLMDDLGEPAAAPTLWSNRDWLICAYPPEPPGCTPGWILQRLIAEAQSRGCLAGLTLAFDALVDSDGNPWTPHSDFATKIGNDLLTVARELVSAGYIDVMMSPGEWRLYAWQQGGAGIDTNVSLHPPTDAGDPLSANLTALTHRRVT